MKRIRSLLLMTIFGIMLAACGASATPTVQPTQNTAAQTTPEASPEASPEVSPEASPEASPETTAQPLTGQELTIYSGRSESLIKPLIEEFTKETGIKTEVRYGDTAELAAQIKEEGDNSPADVFFGQDAGALGSLSDRFVTLEDSIINKVDAKYRSPEKTWVGVSGRARVLVYNTDKLKESDLPASVVDLTDPKWLGRIGWSPTNGSFQAFVTALRVTKGEDAAKAWLEGMVKNAKTYSNNAAIVQAVANGEIDAGLVNHYYLFALKKDKGEVKAANYYFPNGDIGSLINVAGVGVLKTGKHQEPAEKFVEFLLETEAQEYFAKQTFEYPLADGVPADPQVKPLSEISSPAIDLSNLKDLQGTVELLEDTGAVK